MNAHRALAPAEQAPVNFDHFAITDDWPCPCCGVIGCEHDDELPPYLGAFDSEGRM